MNEMLQAGFQEGIIRSISKKDIGHKTDITSMSKLNSIKVGVFNADNNSMLT